MAYKRKRIYAPKSTWGSKKRRTVRSRKSRYKKRVRSNTSYSSRTLDLRNVQRKGGKKLSKRAWRSLLWRNTLTDTKYKSALSALTTNTTPTNSTSKSLLYIPALSSVVGNEFYRTAGGLQDQNFGVVPNLGTELSSIVIRGGIIFCNIALVTASTDPVIINVELRRLKQQTRNFNDTNVSNTADSYLGAIVGTARPLTWTLDDAPDSQEYVSRAYLSKSMILQAGQMFHLEHRLKVEKIDVGAFEKADRAWFWFISASQVQDALGVAETFNVIVGHDLSFAASADAI
jgi:hypothetical protein